MPEAGQGQPGLLSASPEPGRDSPEDNAGGGAAAQRTGSASLALICGRHTGETAEGAAAHRRRALCCCFRRSYRRTDGSLLTHVLVTYVV